MEPPPAKAADIVPTQLLDVVAEAGAWSSALVNLLDASSRLALCQTSSACSQLVCEESQQATVQLLAYGLGLSEHAWQSRLSAAEQALGQRAQRPCDTKLVVRIATPSPAPLQSILSINTAAAQAVTQLRVQQLKSSATAYEGLRTAWLAALPDTFPNLHTLHINRLCGRLPPAERLPKLAKLYVQVWPASGYSSPAPDCTPEQLCASIAAYVPQLTSLHVQGPLGQRPWDQLFAKASNTLTRLVTNKELSDQLLGLLLAQTPNLQYVGCEVARKHGSTHREAKWGVTKLQHMEHGSHMSTARLAQLPESPAGLLLLPRPDSTVLRLGFDLQDREGLSQPVRERVSQWRVISPCAATITLPRQMQPDDLHAGLLAALQQLSGIPCSEVTVAFRKDPYPIPYPTIAAATAAVAQAMPGAAFVAPVAPGSCCDDKVMAELCSQQPPVSHPQMASLQLSSALAGTPWPWQSLRVVSPMQLMDLLNLPDPSGGQYTEIHVRTLYTNTTWWLPEMFDALQQRLQHWTFPTTFNPNIWVSAPTRVHPEHEPEALRTILQALSGFRWRHAPDGQLTVTLSGWTMSTALMAELRGLPTLQGVHARLAFSGCKWLDQGASYRELAGLVPTGYSTWELQGWGTWRHGRTKTVLLDMCRGSVARGEGCKKLTLCVQYAPRGLVDEQYCPVSDEERSVVEACIDQQGLYRYMTAVHWDSTPAR